MSICLTREGGVRDLIEDDLDGPFSFIDSYVTESRSRVFAVFAVYSDGITCSQRVVTLLVLEVRTHLYEEHVDFFFTSR